MGWTYDACEEGMGCSGNEARCDPGMEMVGDGDSLICQQSIRETVISGEILVGTDTHLYLYSHR